MPQIEPSERVVQKLSVSKGGWGVSSCLGGARNFLGYPILLLILQMKILVVDDNDVDVELLSDSLAPLAELEILRLKNGRSALEWLSKAAPSSVDLVLIDWRLPSTSGDQIARAFLARTGSARPTPIAILSCSTLPPKVREQISGLGGLIFEKPMDLEGYASLAAQLVALARAS